MPTDADAKVIAKTFLNKVKKKSAFKMAYAPKGKEAHCKIVADFTTYPTLAKGIQCDGTFDEKTGVFRLKPKSGKLPAGALKEMKAILKAGGKANWSFSSEDGHAEDVVTDVTSSSSTSPVMQEIEKKKNALLRGFAGWRADFRIKKLSKEMAKHQNAFAEAIKDNNKLDDAARALKNLLDATPKQRSPLADMSMDGSVEIPTETSAAPVNPIVPAARISGLQGNLDFARNVLTDMQPFLKERSHVAKKGLYKNMLNEFGALTKILKGVQFDEKEVDRRIDDLRKKIHALKNALEKDAAEQKQDAAEQK